MGPLVVVEQYFLWHYSRGVRDFLGIFQNYLWFIGHLFSVGTLIKTLFSPFKRIEEEKKVNIIADTGIFFENLLVNMIMRVVGMIVRLALLTLALGSFVTVLLSGIIAFVLWIFLPVIILYFLVMGVRLLV